MGLDAMPQFSEKLSARIAAMRERGTSASGSAEPAAAAAEQVAEAAVLQAASDEWAVPPPPARDLQRPKMPELPGAVTRCPEWAAAELLDSFGADIASRDAVRERVDYWRELPRREPAHLRFVPKFGSFLWNNMEDKPSRPVWREFGAGQPQQLQGSKINSCAEWAEAGLSFGSPGHDALHFVRLLVDWLRARPAAGRVDCLYLVPDELELPTWDVAGGFWVYAHLRGKVAPDSRLPEDWQWGYHGTTMYSVTRIMAGGMQEGFATSAEGGHDYVAIYYNDRERRHLCESYMMYSRLDASGWLCAPVVLISGKFRNDPHNRKLTLRRGSRKQFLCYGDTSDTHGVYFHCVHLAALLTTPACRSFSVEGEMVPELELDPEDSWQVICDRAKARYRRET